MSTHSPASPTQPAEKGSTAAEHRRYLAQACHQLADERLDSCANPVVAKRYAGDMPRLTARRQTALIVMEAAALLIRDAEILEARQKKEVA